MSVGCSERTALKQVYYQEWNRSPAQVGCTRWVLRAGAPGRPRGMGWGGRREEGSGWGTRINPWPIHVNVWQKPLQYCKVISLQLIKINGKEKEKKNFMWNFADSHIKWLFRERKNRSQEMCVYMSVNVCVSIDFLLVSQSNLMRIHVMKPKGQPKLDFLFLHSSWSYPLPQHKG